MRTWLITLVFALVVAAALAASSTAQAEEDWAVRSFDATISVDTAGSIHVVEDIAVDFGALPSHGIFRDIPVRYRYDDDHDRLVSISALSVDDGAAPVPLTSSTEGGYLHLKIGDPDVTHVGAVRYRIQYTVAGALNPFADHDELYWNVTGDKWETTVEAARATIDLPGGGIQ